jgi:hypothetical protein
MFLFAPKTDKRPGYLEGKGQMQEICLKCHTTPHVEKFYREAENVVASTNDLVVESLAIIDELRKENLLTPAPFDEPIEYVSFDLWHYGGRTAKHGAYMGGADFVQWHGFYEVVSKLTELKRMAAELREKKAAK